MKSSSSFQATCDKLLCGGQSKGAGGEQNRAENEQIQRQRKESKGTSEVRRQSHCVRATIAAAPTVSTRPASEKIQLPPQPTAEQHRLNQTTLISKATAGRLVLV